MLAQPALEASSTRDDGMKARKEVCVDSGIAWETGMADAILQHIIGGRRRIDFGV